MPVDNGGPAFPIPDEPNANGTWRSEYQITGDGKTLLDDFAGQAMQALIASSSTRDHDTIAKASYDYAEAMVAEKRKRERRP